MQDRVFSHDASLYLFYLNVKNCLSTAKVEDRKDTGDKLVSSIRDLMVHAHNFFIKEIPDEQTRHYCISYTNHYLLLLIEYIEDKINYRDLERQTMKYRSYKRLYNKIRKRYISSSMGKASDDYHSMLRLKFTYSLIEENSPFEDVQQKILAMKNDISSLDV